MFRKYYRLIAVLLFFIPLCISAQQDLSLKDAIEKGLENNFQVRIFAEKEEIARLNNSWGTVGRYPSINLGVRNTNRYDNIQINTSPETPDNIKSTYGIVPNANLNWLLFNGFSVKISKEKLELLEELSEGASAVVIENTLQSIILAYYLARLEMEKLKIMGDIKELSGDRFRYEEEKQRIGSSVTYDVLQAKNSFYSDSTSYLMQKMNVQNAMLNLNLLLGEPNSVTFNLTDSFDVSFPDYEFDVLMQKMISSNKTLQNQYINQEIMKKELKLSKSELYPSLSLNAGTDYNKSWYSVKDADNYNSNSFDYYANFTLSFNLFNGGNTRRAIQTAEINNSISQLETDEMLLSLGNLLTNQFELYQIRKQLYDVADLNFEVAGLNLQISTDKYRNGSINSFNFRDVQLIYLNAAQRKLSSLFDLIDIHTELLRLTGGILTENGI